MYNLGASLLPFLKNKNDGGIAGISVKTRQPDNPDETKPDSKLEAAKDLIECIHSKDAEGVMEAFDRMFQESEEEPHAEGPHTNESE